MKVDEFEDVLKVGEHIGVEFKSARGGAKDDVFESVCSFLNRFGGDIFLGVADDGEVLGVPENAAVGMIKNVIRVTNNPELLNPIKSHEPINDPIKPREGINETVNETVNSIVLELIRKTPGIGSAALALAVGKSRATVMRAVALLKQRHLIEHRGSDKTGGYYAI